MSCEDKVVRQVLQAFAGKCSTWLYKITWESDVINVQ